MAIPTITIGQASVGATATQLPDVPCKRVHLRARTQSSFLGHDDTVSSINGYPLVNGDAPIELRVNNLSEIWAIESAAGAIVAFIAEF